MYLLATRLAVTVLIVATGSGLSAQSTSANPPKTVTEVLDKSVAGAERAVLSLGEMMPADRYSFKPTNGEFAGVRNFGQMLKHVAVDNYVNGAALLGETPPMHARPRENGPDSLTDKDAILKFVRDSFVYLHRAVATVNEKTLMQPVSYSGVQVSRLAVVMSASAHPWDLYGQMIEYVRMNGINPQDRALSASDLDRLEFCPTVRPTEGVPRACKFIAANSSRTASL